MQSDFASEPVEIFKIHNLLGQGVAQFKCPLKEKIHPFLNSLWTCSPLSLGIAYFFYKDRNIHNLTTICLSLGRKNIKSSFISLLRHLFFKLKCPSLFSRFSHGSSFLSFLLCTFCAFDCTPPCPALDLQNRDLPSFFCDRLGLIGASLPPRFH